MCVLSESVDTLYVLSVAVQTPGLVTPLSLSTKESHSATLLSDHCRSPKQITAAIVPKVRIQDAKSWIKVITSTRLASLK